jgi:hypothetical protein
MAYLAFWLVLVGGKAALVYGVWRLAKAQGRSPWLPLIASILCASIVFLALFLKGQRNTQNTLRVLKFKLIHHPTIRTH